MQLSDLRFWHWMIISVLLGLLIGYSLNAIGPDALITKARAAKTSQTTFEAELLQPPQIGANGKSAPMIANLVVYPDGPIDLLRMDRLIITDRSSKVGHYETFFYDAHRPYSPIDPELRTDVWVKPDFRPDGYFGDRNWNHADGVGKEYRDPGSDDGARLFPDIAKGNYDVVIAVDDARQAADLSLKFNDHPLPSLSPDPKDGRYFHTTISESFFDAQNKRELSLTRKDAPVHIHRMHIFNPTYTVRDYLNTLMAAKLPNGSRAHPQVAYRYGWWVTPKAVLWLSVGGCFLVIGVIWPIVANLLTGAGFGPPPREKKSVNLRKLKATPVLVTGSRTPTDEEMMSVAQMADEMEANLAADAGSARPSGTAAGSGAPIRALNAKAVEPPPIPVARKDDSPKTFKGEYYPVARKVVPDEKKDDES